MSDLEENALADYIATNVARLDGPDADDAFHNLADLGDRAVPLLVDAYAASACAAVRAEVVGILWRQYGGQQVFGLLTEAVNDTDDRVWKAALDGLVATGGAKALEVLTSARDRAGPDAHDKVQWIDEAIDQSRGS